MKHLILFTLLSSIFSACELPGDEDLKIIYFPNSEVIKQSIEYKDGKKNGKFKSFFRNGNPKAIQTYVNDTLNDTSFLFHENGRMASFQVFKKNVKIGCWKKFNKEGREYWNTCFEDGVFHGPANTYSYRSLKPLLKFNFVHGHKEGKQETYHENGKLKSVVYLERQTPYSTEEWQSNGQKVNNDFKIFISEKNELLMENKISFIITLENPHPDDAVYEISSRSSSGNSIDLITRLFKKDQKFIWEYPVAKGGFVMQEIHIAAFRKTAFGNTFIKKTSFMAAANNY